MCEQSKDYALVQEHLFKAIGRDKTPTFLGGDLNFDAVARVEWDKMDAAISERQAHPKGQQVRCICWRGMACRGGVGVLLGYVNTRVEWDKMDVAISERQAHPKGQQVSVGGDALCKGFGRSACVCGVVG